MGDLVLGGTLQLMGTLNLEAEGGKVVIDAGGAQFEVLVEGATGTAAPPVIQPPPPATPLDTGVDAEVISSFNQTVKAGGKNIVTGGVVMQGDVPTWPGMMLPSAGNTGPVLVSGIPATVQNDQATIFPSGGVATFTTSGQ